MTSFKSLLHYEANPDKLQGARIDWKKLAKANENLEQSLLWFTPAVTVEIEVYEKGKVSS